MAKIGPRKRSKRRRSAGRNKKGRVVGATVRASLRTIALLFPPQSLERVCLHGRWQLARGRQPCLTLDNLQDRRLAYRQAEELVGEYLSQVLSQPGARGYWLWTNGSGPQYVRAIRDRTTPREVFNASWPSEL